MTRRKANSLRLAQRMRIVNKMATEHRAHGKYGGVSSDSPLKVMASPEKRMVRTPNRFVPDGIPRPQRVPPQKAVSSKREKTVVTYSPHESEVPFQILECVLAWANIRATFKSLATKGVGQDLLRSHDVKFSYETLLKWTKKFEKEGVDGLLRKKGSGTTCVHDHKKWNDFLLEFAKERKYNFSYLEAAIAIRDKALQESTPGTPVTWNHPPVSFVHMLMEKFNWRKRRKYRHPGLTNDHKVARLRYCQEYLGNFGKLTGLLPQNGQRICMIHVDESNFVLHKGKPFLHLPPSVSDEDAPYDKSRSEAQTTKVMFLSAVAHPREDFDGKIACVPVLKEVLTKKNSKYRIANTIDKLPSTLTADMFVEEMKKICDNLLSKQGSYHFDEFHIIFDNASAHVGKGALEKLNEWGKTSKKRFLFSTQPAQSPDLNVLDLGLWRSLKCSLQEFWMNSDDEPMREFSKVIKKVKLAWKGWDRSKIASCFKSLMYTMEKIVKDEGGNNFKQPHENDVSEEILSNIASVLAEVKQ